MHWLAKMSRQAAAQLSRKQKWEDLEKAVGKRFIDMCYASCFIRDVI